MSDEERGGDDERDALAAEEIMAEMNQQATERLLVEFTPEQIAEWFVENLSGEDLAGIVNGLPLDPNTGKPVRKETDDPGF